MSDIEAVDLMYKKKMNFSHIVATNGRLDMCAYTLRAYFDPRPYGAVDKDINSIRGQVCSIFINKVSSGIKNNYCFGIYVNEEELSWISSKAGDSYASILAGSSDPNYKSAVVIFADHIRSIIDTIIFGDDGALSAS